MTGPGVEDLVRRVLRLFDFRRFGRRTRRWITAIAGLVFVGGGIVSWQRLMVSVSDLRFWPIILILLTAPISLILSGAEFRLMGRGLGRRIGWGEAMDVALVGYAGNMLPIPGGALVRVSTLTGREGITPGKATRTTLTVGLTWLGVSLAIAGAGLLSIEPLWGSLCLGAAVVVLVAGVGLVLRSAMRPSAFGFTWRLVLLELVFVLVGAVRTFLAFLALGYGVDVVTALVVATSSAMSAAVGIAPAGLGIREGLSAGLAALTGVPASLGFLAAVVLRIAGMAAAALVALALTLRRQRSDTREDPFRAGA